MTKHFLKHLRTKVFAGILVLLPLGITFLVLKFVFNTLDSILGPLMPPVTVDLFDRLYEIPGLGIIAFFLMLYLIGVIATNVLGRKLVQWTDWIFINIPVVKTIYLSSKQLTDAFSASRKGAFRQAVFVEFPQPGNFVLGFLTNELKAPDAQAKMTVFVPTAFFPPQGFLLFLPREKVIPSSFTIEDAIKAIMSVGIVTPNGQSLRLPEASPRPPSQGEAIANIPEMKYVKSKTEGGL
jgi:uncharacterized membrane protein